MLLNSEHGFQWVSWLAEHVAGVEHVSVTATAFIAAAIVTAGLLLVGLRVRMRVVSRGNYLVPDAHPTLTGWFDVGVNWLADLFDDLLGDTARKHFTFLGSIFFYILLSNMAGLIPGFTPATTNLNANLAVGMLVFVYYHYMGVKSHGAMNYLKHFAGPIIWLAPLFFIIELISHAVRPLSLAIRLFGNMTVDHAVLGVFTDLTKVIVPVIFLGLGLFVCFVQAFVFTLLSAVYIALAQAHDESHTAHDAAAASGHH